jgi:hypothetical protein
MRRSSLMVTLAVVCLLVMAVFTAWAMEGEEGSCAAACREAKDRCVTSCGANSDPIECEDQCERQAQECLEQCGER